MARKWSGRHIANATAECKRLYGNTCWLCGHPIPDDDYTVDHVIERAKRPDLTFEPSNWRPAHGRKHPEIGCPGNFGRSGRKVPIVRTWTAAGW